MIEPLTLTKRAFRTLLYGVILSFFYDIVHLSLRSSFYWDFELFYHDTERGVRRFSLICAYLLVFFKFFQMIIMWKVSVDYDEIVRYKARSNPLDFDLESENSEMFTPSQRSELTAYNM